MTPVYKYEVSIDPTVYNKMYDHVKFLAKASISAAERLYAELDEAIIYLKSNPESCPRYYQQFLSDINLRYKLFGKRYRVVFEVIGNKVFVYDIQDCRQSIDKSLVD